MRIESFYNFLILLLGIAMVSCSNVNHRSGIYHVIALENTNDTCEFLSWTNDRIPLVSAHRGGRYYMGYTENTIEVFEYTISHVPSTFAVLITYTLDVAKEIHQKYPTLFLSVTVRNHDELVRLLNSNINLDNVVAFTGTSARDRSFNEALHELGVFTILGTMGNIDNSAMVKGDFVYDDIINSGSDILSTDFPIEAHNAFKNLIPEESSKSLFFKIDGK